MVNKRRGTSHLTSPTNSGLSPNPFDTEPEIYARSATTQEAAATSKKIEAWLLEGKKALKRRREGVKILLLGQSESGKSAVLKNFQLAFAPKHFERERSAWKIIVQLNLIGSIKTILDALHEEYYPDGSGSTPLDAPPESALRTLHTVRLSLSPLFLIESNVLNVLAPGCADCRRMFVRAGVAWKALLLEKTSRAVPVPSTSNQSTSNTADRRASEQRKLSAHLEYDPTPVLVAQRNDIIKLWKHAEVQEILKRRRPWLKGSSGFFMDDIERITTLKYLPTDFDIIRARIKTHGVEEHALKMERGMESAPREFYITDVGGSRGQRAMWVPFFEDVHCILFLAPLAFNETLEEDPKVNRLEDSLNLWREICSNKLLSKVQIILFLNKKDVLATTLAAGVQVKKYVPTFENRANDVQAVTQFFKEEFRHYHKKVSPKPRSFVCHETSAIDIGSMQALLAGVQDTILRRLLRQGDLV